MSRGLLFSAVAHAGSFVNLLNGTVGTKNGTPTNSISELQGPAMDFTSSGDNVSFPFPTVAPKNLTVAAIVKPGSITASDFLGTGDGTGAAGWGIRFGMEGSGNLCLTFPAIAQISSGDLLFGSTNATYVMAASWENAVGVTFVIRPLDIRYSNSTEFESPLGTTTLFIPSASDNTHNPSGTIYVGNGDAGAGSPAGRLSAVMYRGASTPTPILQQFVEDPWPFWLPLRRRYFTNAAAAGGTRGLFFNSTLSGLGAGGSFFSDRLAS